MLKKSLQQILFEGKFQISLARFKKQSNSIDLSPQANSLMLNPSGLRPPLSSRLTRIWRGITRRLQFVRALIGLPGRLASWLVSRRIQRSKINQFRYGTRKKLVIFLIPGIQRVVGGMLQVFSLHRLSREFFKGTEVDSLICWLPGEGWADHRYDGFNNDVTVFPLKMVLKLCAPKCELMIHLPEFAAERFCNSFGWDRLTSLRESNSLRINILQQNSDTMPSPSFIKQLLAIFSDLSSTVCNSAWVTVGERRRLGIPLHFLPTWYYPDDAPWQPYESKENLLIVSPDPNPNRDLIIGAIRNALPSLRIQVIWGLKYEQYLELERAAKWSITFGEGLDGYFYGPMLRGGVAFAVRNATFDLPGLEEKTTIYPSYEVMANRIVEDIKALDSKVVYEAYNKSVRGPLKNEFGRDRTTQALAAFYRGEWTLP